MEWESDSPCCSHTYTGQGCSSPRRRSGCELQLRDCGAISGLGLLLTVERRTEGMWGRRPWWEMAVEESQTAMEARRYGWVTWSGWRHHHSLSPHRPPICSWTIEKLARQVPDTLKYRVGPHTECSFKCLKNQTTEKDPRQESAWMGTLSAKVPEWAELQRKTGQRGLLITSYQKFKKKKKKKHLW